MEKLSKAERIDDIENRFFITDSIKFTAKPVPSFCSLFQDYKAILFLDFQKIRLILQT